jgi:hypothetical protein
LLLLASFCSAFGSNLSVTIDLPANNSWSATPYLFSPYDTGPYLGVAAYAGYETQDSFYESIGVGTTVTCRVRRDADGYYWNGSAWGTDAVDLSTDVNGFSQGDGRVWKCTAGLPLGPQIVEGSYTLTAHASEGFSSDDTSGLVTCDFTTPVLTVTSPQDGTGLLGFPFIGGTAMDPPGRDVNGNPSPASGVAQVTLSLFRQSDGALWDGTNWDLSGGFAGYFQVNVNNDGTWGYALPPAAVISNDRYWLTASCCDRAGNCLHSPGIQLSFFVDTLPPNPPTFTFPAAGATVAGLPSITGLASDNPGGSGISRVLVSLQRTSDSTFWDGSGWTSETYFPASFSFVPTPVGFAPQVGWSVAGTWPSATTLANGSYQARAYAYDAAGNLTVSTNAFTVNKQNPTIAFTSPPNGSAFSSFPSIYGTATAAAGLGIAHVDLYIYKESWLAYWDGMMWDDQNTTLLPTTLTGPTTWYYEGALPGGTNAADDTYSLIAYAYDNASNSTVQVIYFSIDTTNPPPPSIDWPANGAAFNSLPLIRGTGTDNPGGSGFQTAILFLSRLSDGLYWNGSAWDIFSFASILGVNPSGTNWVRNFGLPSGTNLTEGVYSFVARSEDWAGNLSDIQSNFFTVDLTPPLVSFLTPAPNTSITSLALVQGVATDTGGSGVQRVDLSLQRVADGSYWDGNTWMPQLATLATTLQGTNWSRASGLPGANDLKPGAYELRAVAQDTAGNTSEVHEALVVPPPPTILTTLSGGTLTLAWSTNAGLFSVESTPSLSPPSWTPVTQQQQIVNGFYTISVSPFPSNSFFRLRQ